MNLQLPGAEKFPRSCDGAVPRVARDSAEVPEVYTKYGWNKMSQKQDSMQETLTGVRRPHCKAHHRPTE